VLTTAEGVETDEQLETLRLEHCDEVQGYLLGPPKTALSVFKAIVDLDGQRGNAALRLVR